MHTLRSVCKVLIVFGAGSGAAQDHGRDKERDRRSGQNTQDHTDKATASRESQNREDTARRRGRDEPDTEENLYEQPTRATGDSREDLTYRRKTV
ncbi:MAG: hypothetical protein M3475_01185 [Actinomycetota bacterium]|nr:hypothetical protein [Actinomycetota bacterium]